MGARCQRTWCCWRRACSTGSWGFRASDRLTGRGIYYGAALVEAVSCKDEEVYCGGGREFGRAGGAVLCQICLQGDDAGAGRGLAATMSKYLIDEIERTSNIVVEPRHAGIWRRRAKSRLEDLSLRGPKGRVSACQPRRYSCLLARRRERNGCPTAILRDDKGFRAGGAGSAAGREARRKAGRKQREPFLLESSVPGVFVAGDVRHGR